MIKNGNTYIPNAGKHEETVPFGTPEEAWFWFILAQSAKEEGARVKTGAGLTPRPCEPVDILNILDRLYRQRRLLMDHLHVLRYYGRRMMPPDGMRVKEMRAHTLWREAFEKIGPVLEEKGIVRRSASAWVMEAAE
jgi:hypothetical protein